MEVHELHCWIDEEKKGHVAVGFFSHQKVGGGCMITVIMKHIGAGLKGGRGGNNYGDQHKKVIWTAYMGMRSFRDG